VLNSPLSVESGELSAAGEPKRSVIEARYSGYIEAMYG